MAEPIIEVTDVSKTFPTRRGARDLRGRGGIGDWIRGRKMPTFEALKEISLAVDSGESLGIIGRNGSGKSTLLSIIAGVTLPTTGSVVVRGRVASLLELGAGFHPMLTGRENVYLNAGLLGMRHAQVDEVFDRIAAFSGIGTFIDQPVDTYSSGMYVRIGFAIAVHVNPDVFLVDEVLSVGDEEFQRKCRRRIGELREEGKTIVFVSHDLGIVNTLCERVVLLREGRMIHRETAQKTISYYLRQIGRDMGVHTFSEGAAEMIQCDGRLSLFHHQEEVSAPDGFGVYLEAMRQRYAAPGAEWEVVERTPTGCVVHGQMTRLPVRLIWTLSLQEGRLRWHMAMECQHEVTLTRIDAILYLSTAYVQWFYGDLAGRFPQIRATEMTWNILASPWDLLSAPESGVVEAALLAEEGSALPPLRLKMTPHNPYFGAFLANSEYVSFSRMFLVQARFPEERDAFSAGYHDLVTIEVDLTAEADDVRRHVQADRTLESGPLTAFFDRGQIKLSYEGQEFTAFLHVYASMLIEQLWNDSHGLKWGPVQSDGRRISVKGESRRFPFQQFWEIERAEGGIALRIWLEAFESFDVQEYHTSIVLDAEYERWNTDHEEGVFAPFDPTANKWQHLNRTYAPGKRATALCSTLPSVTLEVTTDEIPFRMTAINTKAEENARVLQALCPSDAGHIHFDKGRHLYFAGVISAAPPLSAPAEDH